ncbi:beta-1,3-galactosyltransferase 5-like [Hyperolius riggenbachi]|uniref:beta-1,3-galactosyltransferase 5-like n=1 Tax=Hyperolius riggenbachi TaxID=752182 RepID=UPI0035A2C85A
MKIRTVIFLQMILSTIVFLFIAQRILNHPVKEPEPDLQKVPPPPQRQSVTLKDEAFTYHLNYSQHLAEFPFLQSYRCSHLLAPPTDPRQEEMTPLLLLAIKSHPRSTARRNALRQTWAREGMVEGYRIRPVFLMAQSDGIGYMDLVKMESEEYKDILQWDFYEDHHNLSLKERCFLEWLHMNTSNVDFIFKGDDDEFVNPAALVRYIKERGTPYVMHGAVQHHSVVMRSTKYQISTALFPYPKYPNFLSGGGYLFPGPSVRHLHRASQTLPVFPLDDVYFGFLVLAANLSLRDEKRFYVWGLDFNACLYQQALVVHRVELEKLLKVWATVLTTVCKDNKAPIK